MLKAANNQLPTIDLSGCPNVKVVDLETNNIEHLDLAKNVAITWLLVANNKLDVYKRQNLAGDGHC